MDGGNAIVCSSPMTYNGLSEGVHVFSVNATDSLGNTGKVPATFQWSIDFTPPVTSIIDVTPVDAVTNATYKTFTFSADESSSFECSMDGAAFAACTSPVSLNSLGEGNHGFEVRGIDAAGNMGLSATYSWSIDLTKPEITFGTVSPAQGLTNSKNISVEFSTSENATVYCSMDGAAAAVCASPFAAGSLGEGDHTVSLYAIDTAGNQSDLMQIQWSMDFTAPVISFGAITPSAASIVNVNQLSFEVNAPQGVALSYSLNGSAWASTGSPIALSGLSEGDYQLSVVGSDSVGNVSDMISHSFHVDITAPQVQLVAAITVNLTNSDHNSFSFTASEDGVLECNLDGAGFAACTSPQDVAGLADGVHSFQVRATDEAGNVSAIAERSWTVDTAPPTTSINAVIGTDSATFDLSSNEAGTFICTLDSAPINPCVAHVTYDGLDIGLHNFVAKAIDAAGNVDPVGATYQFGISKPIHTTLTSKIPPDQLTNLKSMTFTFVADQDNATFKCSLDGSGYTPCTSPLTYNNLSDGSHNFIVKAVDQFGNMDSVGASYSWTIDSVGPVITSITFNISTNTITVNWVTNEPSTGQVRFGIGANLNQMSALVSTRTTSHTIQLTGLSSNTTYSIQVISADLVGNVTTSATKTAKTSR
jgi:hypothetical protein